MIYWKCQGKALFSSNLRPEEIISTENFIENQICFVLGMEGSQSFLRAVFQQTSQEILDEVHKKGQINGSGAATKIAPSGPNSDIANVVTAEEGAQLPFRISSESVIETEQLRFIFIQKSKHIKDHHS